LSHTDTTTKPCLVDVQLAFAHWRESRTKRGPTPERLRTLALQLLPSHSRSDVCKALAINSAALRQWTGGSTERVAAASKDFVDLSHSVMAHEGHQVGSNHSQFTITLPNGVQVGIQGECSVLDVLSAASATDISS